MRGETLDADIEKRYTSEVCVSARFQLALRPPGVTILFGPSGAGKTTILRCIAGLERLSRGRIELAGRPWSDPEREV